MRRICSFTDLNFVVSDCMRLSGAWILTDLPQLEESSAVQAQENQYQIQKQERKSVKDKIRRIGAIRDSF